MIQKDSCYFKIYVSHLLVHEHEGDSEIIMEAVNKNMLRIPVLLSRCPSNKNKLYILLYIYINLNSLTFNYCVNYYPVFVKLKYMNV